jgi:hypothetical protein
MRTMIGLLRTDDPDEPRTAPGGLDRLDELLATARAAGLRVELDDRRAPARCPPRSTSRRSGSCRRPGERGQARARQHGALRPVRRGGALELEVVNDLVPGAAPGGRHADRPGRARGARRRRRRADPRRGRRHHWTVRAVLPVPVPA